MIPYWEVKLVVHPDNDWFIVSDEFRKQTNKKNCQEDI
jgi:hypothetical protein